MAQAIRSFKEFASKISDLKDSGRLFAFILYDDRKSHEPVAQFLEDYFKWLDALAKSSKMFVFMFLKRKSDNPNNGNLPMFYLKGKNAAAALSNPSLEVGKMFDVKPDQLPGIVIFALDEKQSAIGEGVYLHIDVELFKTDQIEKVFTNLFSIIRSCRRKADSNIRIIDLLQEKIYYLRMQNKLIPVEKYVKVFFFKVVNLPTKFITSMAEAYGTEIAKKSLGA